MFVKNVVIRNVRVWLMVASLGIPGWTSAAEIQWVPKNDEKGFTVMMPDINIDALVDDIARLKIALRHDEKLLAEQVEQKRVTGNDKVISFLMPGGLIYAAYKKNAHSRAVQDHELVVSQLKEISTDLTALMAISGPVVVAKR